MSSIELSSQPGLRRTSGPEMAGSRQAAMNQSAARALLVLLALVPLPFGSVHGFSWGFFAAYVGLAGLGYAISLLRLGESLRVPITALAPELVLFAGFIAALVLQLLPLGTLLGPFVLASADGYVVASNTISATTNMTFLMLVRQLGYLVFFILVLQVTFNDTRRRFFLDALLLIIVAYAAIAVVSLQTGDTVLGIPKTAYEGSATGPFVNRNSFATFLGFGALIAIAQIGRRIVDQLERHPHDGSVPGNASAIILYAIAYLGLLTVIVATQSRMGLVATLAGSGVVIAVVLTRSLVSGWAALLVTAVIVAGVAGGLALFGGAFLDRVFEVERAASNRSDLYAQVLELIAMRPFLGFGGGSFEMVFPLVHQPPVSLTHLWDKAHSTYLTLWTELGVIAGTLPMLVLAFFAVRIVLALRAGRGSWMAQAIALGALVLSAVHSLVDFSLEIPANTFVLLALLGAGLATTNRQMTR